MAYVYKKFSPQDKAIIPFNAHKQYNFTSASAALNQVTHYNTSFTSESISNYSTHPLSASIDTINTIKYNQIDHLFYRNHITNIGTKKDNNSKQRKNLYQKSNLLSIPSGLYGSQIKKSSFYLSSSQYEVIDDSFGNLIISGTNTSNYPNDIQQNVFRLDPLEGFKKYDLSVQQGYVYVTEADDIQYLTNGAYHQYTSKAFWRQGLENPSKDAFYSSTTKFPIGYYKDDVDDSIFTNQLFYYKNTFKESFNFGDNYNIPAVTFSSSNTSFIKSPHNKNFNFNINDDFAISFYIKPQATGSDGDMSSSEKRYIIAKSGTETVVGSGSYGIDSLIKSPQYPFEIYMQSQSLYFARSDGKTTNTINGEITASGTAKRTSHILCQQSASKMQIWFDGTKIAETTHTLESSTKNKANLYIGSKGLETSADTTGSNNIKHFNGDLSSINIWNRSYTSTQISNISESVNTSPYIGNIFYSTGFATITHPKYKTILSGSNGAGTINTLQFQGTHLIYEHEYQCTVQEHEFNNTINSSALDKTGLNPYKIADFTTGSFFKPYVTTVGLYNEGYELLAIAKFPQPIRMSDETDTTFVIRWDT